jgi:hypothetical protein
MDEIKNSKLFSKFLQKQHKNLMKTSPNKISIHDSYKKLENK